MSNLDKILVRERGNDSFIYLYPYGDKWFAYDHSAYHFMRIFQNGEIELADGCICLVISSHMDFMSSQAINSVEIVLVDDDLVTLNCGTHFSGYEQWKRQLLN